MTYNREIELQQIGNALHVTMEGPFSYARAGELLRLMEGRLVGPTEQIVLDLRLVESLDSTWFWELETLRIRARRASIGLHIRVQEASRVERILTQSGFCALFLAGEAKTEVCAA